MDPGWTSFLKSIASFSGDLSSLTAPPFILSPVSLAEFPSYWGEAYTEFAVRPRSDTSLSKTDAFVGGGGSGDRGRQDDRGTPAARHQVVHLDSVWTVHEAREGDGELACVGGSIGQRPGERELIADVRAQGSEKKPLNPLLGEQFVGKWDGPEGETVLHTEQVSHHPPVTGTPSHRRETPRADGFGGAAYFLENKSKGLSYEGHCAQKTSFSGRTIVRLLILPRSGVR